MIQANYLKKFSRTEISYSHLIIRNQRMEILMSDDTQRISHDIKIKIFQPFFTAKPTGSGTGLGLSLSYDIVKEHGADLKVDSVDVEGAKFIITFPSNIIR